MNAHRLRTAAILTAVLSASACGGDDPPAPGPDPVILDPGFLTVEATTPNFNDGGIQLLLSGPGVDSLRAVGTFQQAHAQVNAGVHRVLIFGTAVRGDLVEFWVPDRSDMSAFSVVVEAAAASLTYNHRDISNYSMRLRRK